MRPPGLGPRIGRVLGTAVYELPLEADLDVLVVSDLHLRPGRPDAIAAFDELLGSVDDGGLVLVLGDLFDYWVGRRQLRAAEWTAVPELLARHAARGLRIYVLHGNRDYQLDRAFERATGVRVVPGGICLARPGIGLLFLHGDELCQNDRKYQRSKLWLRSFPVRCLLHVLPFAWTRRLADRARAVSKESVARANPASLHPSSRALARVRDAGVRRVVFGHIHCAAHGRVAAGDAEVEFFVLPEFEAGSRGHARWIPNSDPRYIQSGQETKWPESCPLGP